MNYYIGIDAGGTKTDSVLSDGDGRVLFRRRDGGCNPNDIGRDAACELLSSIIRDLAAKSPGGVAAVFAGVAGMIGFGSCFTDRLAGTAGVNTLRVESDALPLLTGVLYRADGAAVISGTGSACFIRLGGRLSRVGGWGFMLDGGGSGYDLGRDAISAVLSEYDGRGDKTALTAILTEKMGKHPKNMIPEIYRGGRGYVASFAGAVFEGCRSGDRVSIEIMKRNAACLAELVGVAARRLAGNFTVALGGGILTNYKEFREALGGLLPCRIKLEPAALPPVYGAIVEAVYSAGNDIPRVFRENFAASYGGINI